MRPSAAVRQLHHSWDSLRGPDLDAAAANFWAWAWVRLISVPVDGRFLRVTAPRSTDAAAPDAVLERLQRLEAAVFGATTPAAATDVGSVAQAQPRGSRPGEAPLSEPSRVRRERSAEFDYNQVAPVSSTWPLLAPRATRHRTADKRSL